MMQMKHEDKKNNHRITIKSQVIQLNLHVLSLLFGDKTARFSSSIHSITVSSFISNSKISSAITVLMQGFKKHVFKKF